MSAEPVVSLSQEPMVVRDLNPASTEDRIVAMSISAINNMRGYDELPIAEKMRQWGRDYFAARKRSVKILEPLNDARLQPNVQELASRYITSSGGRVNSDGETNGN